MQYVSLIRSLGTGGDADSTSATDGQRLNASTSPKLKLNNRNRRAGLRPTTLAITMLLASGVNAEAVDETRRRFDAAAKEQAPTTLLNEAEFKTYDLSMGRQDQATQRNIDFDIADRNANTELTFEEALGYEQMRTHFAAVPDANVAFLTKAQVTAKVEAQNDLMKPDTNFEAGFKLTDADSNDEISREEDTVANMIANEFKGIDSNDDDKLEKLEMNKKYPMWNVNEKIEDFSTDKTSITILDYANMYNDQWYADDKCTKLQLSDNLPKRLDKCASSSACYDTVYNDALQQNEYPARNVKCDKSYESCAEFYQKGQTTRIMACIPTGYCGMDGKADKLVWGETMVAVNTKIDCNDGKKEDPNAAKAVTDAAERKKQIEKDATENKMKILGAGQKCTKKGKDLGQLLEAKECQTKASAEDTGCSFFMHSTEYPVEGCHCCDEYKPIDDSAADGKQYNVYQTCVDGAPAKAGADGGRYQKCFNEINLAAHNAYRKEHSSDAEVTANSYKLAIDTKLAEKAEAYARKLKEAGGLSPSAAADRTWEEDNKKFCGESLLKLDTTSAAGLLPANWDASALVSKQFYHGKDAYDATAHKITGDQTKAKHYAQLLWRDSTDVGFGIAGAYVVARYCVEGNNPLDNVPAYGLNVCPVGGCPACPTPIPGIGYDNCYNDIALDGANLKRGESQSSPVALDTDTAAGAQKWAETLDSRGSITSSIVGLGDNERPDGCAEILFEQTDANKVDTLATSLDAIDAWYAGNTEYDAEKGAPKTPDDAQKKALSDNYTKLVWKSSTKAGFGIKGKVVVAWICNKPGNVPYKAEDFKKNISKNCFEKEKDGRYNKCFNDLSLTSTNEKRVWHESGKIENIDTLGAVALQKLIDDKTNDDFLKDTAPDLGALPTGFENCNQLTFTSKEKLDLLEKDVAVEGWYADVKEYDFETKDTKAGGDAAKAANFLQLVWKASNRVAFAVRGQWAFAWFCPKAGAQTENDANVKERCLVDGANVCLQTEQLEKHNTVRLQHSKGTTLKADPKISAAIQKLLDAKKDTDISGATKDFVLATPSARGGSDWTACAENIYGPWLETTAADADGVKASDTWAAGRASYDPATGAAKTDADDAAKKLVENYMRMTWKSTTLVGFGMKDKIVVAWYCEVAAATTDTAKAKENIGEFCIIEADGDTKGRNKCYAELALKKVNEYRVAHDVAEQAENEAGSATLQTAVTALKTDGTAIPDADGCTTIQYEEKDSAKIAALATTAAAPEAWYDFEKMYDYATSRAKPADDVAGETDDAEVVAKANQFTAMMWKASLKASFAVDGKFAAAQFCEAKGNDPDDAATFGANVFKKCITDTVNTCFNTAQLDTHNDKRGSHKDTKDLEWDKEGAKAMMDIVNKLDDAAKTAALAVDPFVFSAATDRPADFQKCGETIWAATDETNAETDKASESIYTDGVAEIDFATGLPVTPDDDAKKLLAQNTMRMLWKSTKKVSFLRWGKYVIVWYCPADAEVGDKDKALENLGEACIVDGADKCFNDIQIEAHNKLRVTHAADALTYNAEIAKHIQAKLDADATADMVQPDAPLAAPCDGGIGFTKYEEEDDKKVAELKTTSRVTDELAKFIKDYDFKEGVPKLGLATPAPSNKFTNIVWRSTTQVGFGIKDKVVTVGYCVSGAATDTTKESYADNVQKACVTDGFNKCFNKLQIDAHNELRLMHRNYSQIKLNTKAAQELQKQMSVKDFAGTVTRTGDWKDCNEQAFTAEDADILKLVTTTAPTDKWYEGKDKYNFKEGKPLTDGDKVVSDLFTQVLWKNSANVAFGINGKYVIAWYCPAGNDGDTTVFKANVGESCIETAGGPNKCVNESYLKAVNAKRELHGSPKLAEDLVAAEAIQKALDEATYTGDPATLTATDGCNQIVYTYALQSAQAEQLLMTDPDTAVGSWYAGSQYYDFEKGTVKYPEDATKKEKESALRDQENFTQLLWKSTTKVGFGIKGNDVVAWYCSKGNTAPAQSYVDNVSDVCMVDGMNRCYNRLALGFHNEKRALRRDTNALALDAAIAKKIQTEMDKWTKEDMDKSTFAGTIADRGAFAACGESIFQQTESSKVSQLATTNAASQSWYAGESEYDMDSGAPKDSSNQLKSAAAYKFTQMVWRSTGKVGFGVRGKWVVAWYCEVQGNTGGPSGFRANVGKTCVVEGINECYTDRALAAHNLRRGYHESKALTLDKAGSKALQALMDDPAFTGSISSRPTIATECAESVFTQDAPAKVATLATSDDATIGWYEGKKFWNFKEGTVQDKFEDKVLTADQKADAADFTRMVWAETTTVAFGIRGRWVVAWYCSPQGNKGDVEAYKKNVQKDCVKDGVDTCYLELALQAHNEKRARHRGGRPLAQDTAASKYIQSVLDKGNFPGSIPNRPNQFGDCGENVYEAKDVTPAGLKEVYETDIVTEAWYTGEKQYDYSTGKQRNPQDAKLVAQSNSFANVVWSSTTRVGFGIKGKWVVAWYCETKATPMDSVASLNNIGKQCRKSGINNCLNDTQLKAHNDYRMMHDTKPLKWDKDLAIALQKQMDAPDNFDGNAITVHADYLADCTQNIYEEKKDATKIIELITSNSSTDNWYKGMSQFNFESGESKAPKDVKLNNQYKNFSRMMWKKTTKVAFGIRDNFVIAWYCNDKIPAPEEKHESYKLYKKNVGKLCDVDGFNTCYNDKALEAHNNAREKHEGYIPLKLDTEIAKAIQAQLNSSAFVGTISQANRGAYAMCGENVFVLTDMTKLSDVQLTNMASNFWYKGGQYYDFNNGTPSNLNNAAENSQSNNFAQMVWKGTTKVGFGVKGKFVVAWYCEDKGEVANAAKSKVNVGKICYKHGYNRCYNDLGIAHVNKMRKNHKAKPMTFDEDAARAIQHELNRSNFNGQMPEPVARAEQFLNCGQSVFYQSDKSLRHEVSTTQMATTSWYQGIKDYDFDLNAPNESDGYFEEAGKCASYLNLKDPATKYRIEQADTENTLAKCKALCEANDVCTGYEFDKSATTKKCTLMKTYEVRGDASIRGPMDSTEAKCFVVKSERELNNADNFTQMIWRGSEKIAFGVKAPWVVAWYCKGGNTPRPGQTGSAASYEKNVARTCIVEGMNVCYNKIALKAHNDKRQLHKDTPPMKSDNEAAKAIQKIMDVTTYNGQMPIANERPAQFRDCAESTYTMTDSSKIEQLSSGVNGSDYATDFWYSQGNSQINYSTGKPNAGGNQQSVDRLLYIIWKTTSRVSFGIKDQYVVAWYCDVTPLSALIAVEVSEIESSPLLAVGGSRRRLATDNNKNVASNAMDGNKQTFMTTVKGVGMKWTGKLKDENMKVQSVKITNANSNAQRFSKYRVVVGTQTCGLTPETVAAGETVIVTCGSAPSYIIGSKVTIETTTDTHLQIAEVEIIGTDGTIDAANDALKNNAGTPCNANGFNSCYNDLARQRHNDYREGHEYTDAVKANNGAGRITTLLITDNVRAKDLQTQMNKATFRGQASQLTVPKDCSMNMYVESGPSSSVEDLVKNHVATDTWYQTGETHYDYKTGKAKAGTSDAMKSAINDFTTMMWEQTQTVSFGIKDKYVVGWYCNQKGNAHGITKAEDIKKSYLANVAPSCLSFTSRIVNNVKMYNKCYNDRELKTHNTQRALHESGALTIDTEMSTNIQTELNAMTRGQIVKMPQASFRNTKYRECGQNVYTGVDVVKLFLSGLATTNWYNGISDYDFENHKPKNQYDTTTSDAFTQLVWKQTETVGFGIRDNTVVAWYCKGGNTPRTPSAFMQNVSKVCVQGTGAQKWNVCYNERALEKHNSYRIIHGTDANGFQLDQQAAQSIQAMLDGKKDMTKKELRPLAYQNCGQSVHAGNDEFLLLTSNEASVQWYAGKKNYNFASGRPDTNKVLSALQFTQIVWNGSSTRKVGFGIKDKTVVAWYCEAGNTPDTAEAFKKHVFEAGNPERCVDDTVNTCYNKKAVNIHNDLRVDHGSPDLTFNHEIAKAAQAELKKRFPNSSTCTGNFVGTSSAERPHAYKDCGENYFFNSNKETLIATDAATDRWYQGNLYWDYKNGVPSVSQSQTTNAQQFATMIWKGTNNQAGTAQNVGFGIHCGYVLAWYCPSKPAAPTVKTTLANVCRGNGYCEDSSYLCNKNGYDECYNQMATKRQNVLRADHCAKPISVDTTMAKVLQKMISAAQQPTDPSKRGEAYKDCYENFYQGNFPITEDQIRDTNIATETWYKHNDKYNFVTGEARPRFVADSFTAIVWNAENAKIAFATRNNFVVAWYCPGPSKPNALDGINTPLDDYTANAIDYKANYLKNIKPSTCTKPCVNNIGLDNYAKCYQDKALAAHNVKRAMHKVPNLRLDIDIAKRAQKHAKDLSEGRSLSTAEKCSVNSWKADTPKNANIEQKATDYWYETGANYDWDKKIYDQTAKDATNLIWRSATRVGFGVHGNHVVAVYCQTKGNVLGRFNCNVCPSPGGCDAQQCPMPEAVCSSDDGHGNAEFSLSADKASMRIIATVKKGQVYSVALGSNSLVASDLIVFHAKTTAEVSKVTDSRASTATAVPADAAQTALRNVVQTMENGDYIRFDVTRSLSTGLTDHYVFTKGRAHDMAWGQYRTSDFAAISAQGTCAFNLKDLDGQRSCPASKRNSTSDPKRQEDCSPHIQQTCFDPLTGAYPNKNCPVGHNCARWVREQGGAKFYADGCVLPQYCGTRGDFGDRRDVSFECPDQSPNPGTTPQPTVPTTGQQGTRCTITQENDANDKMRVNKCSSFDYCTSQQTGRGDSGLCRTNEQCGRYAWKSSSGTTLANLDACILKKYCGIQDAKNPSYNADGTQYEYQTSYQCDGVVAQPTCQNGQVLTAGVCQCPNGQSLVNGYCQAASTCLSAQYQDWSGTCTCAAGYTVTNYGSGCELVQTVTCLSAQSLVGGQCTCPAGQQVIGYGTGCEAPTSQCLSAQTNQNGVCRCPEGQYEINYGTGCYVPPVGPTCLSGQTLVGGVCTCGEGFSKIDYGTGCQAVSNCLAAQYLDWQGQCTCPPGQNKVTFGSGCDEPFNNQNFNTNTCFGVQTNTNGQCTCPFGQNVVSYGTGCEDQQQNFNTNTCLSAQTNNNGICTCPAGETVVQYGTGCQAIQSSVPRSCNPLSEVRAPGGGCQACPTYERPVNGVCQQPTCAENEFNEENGYCYPCAPGAVRSPDGRSCVWANRSLLLQDDDSETMSEDEASEFYLDEVKNVKSFNNSLIQNP